MRAVVRKLGVLAVVTALGCADAEGTLGAPAGSSASSARAADAAAETGWPHDEAVERAPRAPARPVRLVLDPGHGAKDNRGNTGSFCVAEEDFTLALAYDVADVLEELGAFEVTLTRVGSARVPYAERVALADRLRADAFVSLHSDVRGQTETWSPSEGLTCKRSEDAPGFTVLWSDEGPAALVPARQRLGALTARALSGVGFLDYGGEEYEGLYAPTLGDDGAPGLFVDRHQPDKRILVLRRPQVPSIIVETHNALDPREAVRWEEPTTRRAFALALADALAAFVSAP